MLINDAVKSPIPAKLVLLLGWRREKRGLMGHKIFAHAPKIAPTGLKGHKIRHIGTQIRTYATKTASTGKKETQKRHMQLK